MTRKLYKYASPAVLSKVFHGNAGCTLKCSLPRDFNDPYELFLTINRNEDPELLAFYNDTIGDLPQLPTTCFSRSPAVIPMWAHYADSLRGLVIEIDGDRLETSDQGFGIGDVEYREGPDPALNRLLGQAYETTKPRHAYFLNRAVFHAAYFTKATCWAYEQERRLVVPESRLRREAKALLLDVPREAITAILAGPRSSKRNRRRLIDEADRLECRFVDMKISRTSPEPYFVDPNSGDVFLFAEDRFIEPECCCEACEEPFSGDESLCPWCSIEDEHSRTAARRNPFRLLHRYGMLDDYIREADQLGSRGGGEQD